MIEAKDTVMAWDKIVKLTGFVSDIDSHPAKRMRELAKAQAEISFKAGMKHGIWLFAWWKDGVQYVGTSGRTLEEAYKELGLE